nr:DNA primase [Boudabousia tangfeifanii]
MIKREDIEAVRDRSDIERIVSEHVTLRPAGVGSLKGLCPFHDEKTPSFHVRPSLNRWHCFGCGEGGDVISFVEKIHHQSFVEAVEWLAGRLGMTLTYEDGKGPSPVAHGKRQRLAEANRVAEAFFQAQLNTNEGALAREFLLQRKFDKAAAEHFSLGYAPKGWDNLLRHLRSQGFTEAEIVDSGLATRGARGVYDRFRGRLIWPIRDLTGATVGFGARKIFPDDEGPKYLNTPETLLYKKSQVLYGLDLAKKAIVTQKQVVIVEGYTDVMAAHLAGVTTAVATCGTAFGSEHAKMLRRLIGQSRDSASGVVLSGGKALGGEVIFTFDGDGAGQKAALRAFNEDQEFAAQTYVAVAESGLDPCDLRLHQGDQAVRDLVARREPLFAFVIHSKLADLDLDTVEGRVAGLWLAAPVLADIRDLSMRRGYQRELAAWLSLPEAEVEAAVKKSKNAKAQAQRMGAENGSVPAPARPVARQLDPAERTQADLLSAALQIPQALYRSGFDSLDPQWFTNASLRAIYETIISLGGVEFFVQMTRQYAAGHRAEANKHWSQMVFDMAPESLHASLNWLMLQALPGLDEAGVSAYAHGLVIAMQRFGLNHQIANLRSRLQREGTDPNKAVAMLSELNQLEQQRRALPA